MLVKDATPATAAAADVKRTSPPVRGFCILEELEVYAPLETCKVTVEPKGGVYVADDSESLGIFFEASRRVLPRW